MIEMIKQIKDALENLRQAERRAANYHGADSSGHAGYQLSDDVEFMLARHLLDIDQMTKRLQSYEQRCKNDASQKFDY